MFEGVKQPSDNSMKGYEMSSNFGFWGFLDFGVGVWRGVPGAPLDFGESHFTHHQEYETKQRKKYYKTNSSTIRDTP